MKYEETSSRGPAEIENPNKNDDNEEVRSDPLRDLPEWLEEFKDNLVDESVPEHRDASSSSHELLFEPRAKVASGKHSIFTPFPKDRNCDICLRTKITRASSCRRRTDTVVPRAEIFGDLTTADHKVLCGGCESRNNHRYAVVVQDLATQWIQSYPCEMKTYQETEKSLQKFLESTRKPKVIYSDNSPKLGKSCEDLSWNVVCQHLTERKQMGLLMEQCAEKRKGHLRYCCNQVWMKKTLSDRFFECSTVDVIGATSPPAKHWNGCVSGATVDVASAASLLGKP